MMFSEDFTAGEFRRASQRELSGLELQLAERFSWEILPPARDRFGPLLVTSFVRTSKPGTAGLVPESGAHAYGVAADVVRLDRRGDAAANRQLADYFASTSLRSGAIAQVIDERTHVHLALRLVPGARGGYLHEPQEGRFTAADIPAAIAEHTTAGAGALAIAAGLIFLSARR